MCVILFSGFFLCTGYINFPSMHSFFRSHATKNRSTLFFLFCVFVVRLIYLPTSGPMGVGAIFLRASSNSTEGSKVTEGLRSGKKSFFFRVLLMVSMGI